MGDSNIARLPGTPTPVAEVLDNDQIKLASSLLVVGWDEDNKFFFRSTNGAISHNCYLLDICKAALINHVIAG